MKVAMGFQGSPPSPSCTTPLVQEDVTSHPAPCCSYADCSYNFAPSPNRHGAFTIHCSSHSACGSPMATIGQTDVESFCSPRKRLAPVAFHPKMCVRVCVCAHACAGAQFNASLQSQRSLRPNIVFRKRTKLKSRRATTYSGTTKNTALVN